MLPILCIAGRPDSGKTTLITRLIPELKSRGLRIATIKHTSHEIEVDSEGKDTYKHAQAGSEFVVLCSPQHIRITQPTEHSLEPEDIAQLIPEGFDLIIAEGYKLSRLPKIEVHRKGNGELVCPPEELLAIVTDEPLQNSILQLSPDDISALCDLIKEKLLR